MTVSNKVDQFIRDSDIANKIVHGGRDTVVETDGGYVPSFARAIGSIEKVDERITVLEDGQSSGRIVKALWSELSSIPTVAGGARGASVIGDPGTHTDPTTGQTVSNNGDYIETSTGWRWVRAEALASKANRAELDSAVASITRTTSNRPELQSLQRWTDGAGFVAAELSPEGIKTTGFSVTLGGMKVDGVESVFSQQGHQVIYRDEYGFWLQAIGIDDQLLTRDGYRNQEGVQKATDANDYIVRDRYGFWLMSMANAARSAAPEPSNLDVLRDRILPAANSQALATSAAARTQIQADIERPVFDYNIVLVYGQSLAAGYEGWPAKSKVNQEANLLMLGSSTRPDNRSSSTFVPVGEPTLQPLVAVVQSSAAGSRVLSDDEVSRLNPGNNNDGESVEVGAINMWRSLYLDDRWLTSDPSRKVVALNCAVGGMSVARLSKGHASGYFNRLMEAVSRVKAIADAEGKSCGVVALIHLQGEFDYTEQAEGVNDKDIYYARNIQLFNDIGTDVAKGICGQQRKPAVFIYQTGGQYSRDNNELAIGRAQIELAKESGIYMAAPSAPYTDKGGHLDANGYRWLGMQFGKVMHRVLTKSEGWQPVRPLEAHVRGMEVIVSFIVPVPPLRFAASYRVSAPYDPASKGFRVTDTVGEVGIVSAEIADSACVLLRLNRLTVGAVKVWYAPSTVHQGHGSVCDSDSMVSSYSYEYTEGSGDYAAANIPELVGKPYPLQNYSVASVIEARIHN